MNQLHREGRALRFVEAGDGPGMVLVHGWSSDHHSFDRQIEHFAATHRVIAPDLRGHGTSDPGPRHEIDDFADDVAWLARAMRLDRPVVIGHSMGGMIAVEAAAAHPDVFAAAVALDAPLVVDPMLEGGIDLQIDLFAGPRREQDGPAFLRAALVGPYDDPDHATRHIEAMMRTPPEVAVAALASVKVWPRRRRLLDCRQPVLCVHIRAGGPTDPTPLVAGRDNVMVGQVVGCGHFLQFEVPDQVNAMIERFLAVTRAQG